MLSPQERRVFELLKEGLNVREVAARLEISPLAVQNYVNVLRSKLAGQRQSGPQD